MDEIYKEVMAQTIEIIKQCGGGTLSINGATYNLSNCKSHVIIYAPQPLFVEYMAWDIKLETTQNVFNKIIGSVTRLHSCWCQMRESFISNS